MSTSRNPSYIPMVIRDSTLPANRPSSSRNLPPIPSSGNLPSDIVHLYTVPEQSQAQPSPAEAEEEEQEQEQGVVDVHPTFQRDSGLKGNIKVIVGKNEFWCHKDILWFASPFFKDLLQGNWAENTNTNTHRTGRRSPTPARTDVDGIDSEIDHGPSTATSESAPMKDKGEDYGDEHASQGTEGESPTNRRAGVHLDAISDLLAKDQAAMIEIFRQLMEELSHNETDKTVHPRLPLQPRPTKPLRHSFSSSTIRSTVHRLPREGDGDGAEAVVHIYEESAFAFQGFLFWAYPHLECKVLWSNVASLLAISTKLQVPALQSICYNFLLSHAPGQPITALALAELYSHADLYREASRFVLDQPSWDVKEMQILSAETQLKLSYRRTWFLERLLKLGTIAAKRDYQCRAECPDPPRCQMLLDDKWRQANLAICRYGPPQPSVAFNCLRQLETLPTNPSLVMPHPLCQATAKEWIKSLFDRMFQFRSINSPLSPGTEKYWLTINLN